MTYLMVFQTKIFEEAIVPYDIGLHLLDLRFILEVEIPLDEPFVQLDDLTQSQMLTRRFI